MVATSKYATLVGQTLNATLGLPVRSLTAGKPLSTASPSERRALLGAVRNAYVVQQEPETGDLVIVRRSGLGLISARDGHATARSPGAAILAEAARSAVRITEAALDRLTVHHSCSAVCGDDLRRIALQVRGTMGDLMRVIEDGAPDETICDVVDELVGDFRASLDDARGRCRPLVDSLVDSAPRPPVVAGVGLIPLLIEIVNDDWPEMADDAEAERVCLGLAEADRQFRSLAQAIRDGAYDAPITDLGDIVSLCNVHALESISEVEELADACGLGDCDLDELVFKVRLDNGSERDLSLRTFMGLGRLILGGMRDLVADSGRVQRNTMASRAQRLKTMADALLSGSDGIEPSKFSVFGLSQDESDRMANAVRGLCRRMEAVCSDLLDILNRGGGPPDGVPRGGGGPGGGRKGGSGPHGGGGPYGGGGPHGGGALVESGDAKETGTPPHGKETSGHGGQRRQRGAAAAGPNSPSPAPPDGETAVMTG